MKNSRTFFPFVLVALLAAARPTLAQTAPADTARTYQHHLGLSVSPQLDHFFTANRSLPIGLIYRRQTQANKAWRARVVGRYAYNSSASPFLIGEAFNENTLRLEGAFGKEFYTTVNRFALYAGGEVGLNLFHYYRKYQRYLPGQIIFNPGFPPTTTLGVLDGVRRETELGGFIQPYGGVRYYIARRVYVEMEATMRLSLTRLVYKEDAPLNDAFTGVPIGGRVYDDRTIYSGRVELKPINSIRFFFLF